MPADDSVSIQSLLFQKYKPILFIRFYCFFVPLVPNKKIKRPSKMQNCIQIIAFISNQMN